MTVKADDADAGHAATDVASMLCVINGAAAGRDPDAVDFLRASGLPLSSVILALFDQSDDCIKIIDLDGSLQFMNCNGKQAMQIDDFSMVQGKPWHMLWPEESREIIRGAVQTASSGQLNRFEAFCPTAKGEERWWEVSVSPILDPAGKPVFILSSSRDITERKKREETAATVAAEMRHRLLNAHTVGAALVLAAGRHDPEHREFAQDIARRLSTLADLQIDLLSVEGGIDVAHICDRVSAVMDASECQIINRSLPDLKLEEQAARALTLVLGELATNSLKYGAMGRGGEVMLSGRVVDRELVLEWRERFDGSEREVQLTRSSGQGRKLMDQILRLHRGGIQTELTTTGYHADITLPVA